MVSSLPGFHTIESQEKTYSFTFTDEDQEADLPQGHMVGQGLNWNLNIPSTELGPGALVQGNRELRSSLGGWRWKKAKRKTGGPAASPTSPASSPTLVGPSVRRAAAVLYHLPEAPVWGQAVPERSPDGDCCRACTGVGKRGSPAT